jgi:hypothetical protein
MKKITSLANHTAYIHRDYITVMPPHLTLAHDCSLIRDESRCPTDMFQTFAYR